MNKSFKLKLVFVVFIFIVLLASCWYFVNSEHFSDAIECSSCSGECSGATNIRIPEGTDVIGDYAFDSCHSLVSVVIPDSVTSIGEYAFSYCASLESVVIPDSVTSIGESAFDSCTSLKSVVIPDSVTSIGAYAFQHCSSLASIVIPDSVTSIGRNTFVECTSLASVVIPDSVTSIGYEAFYGCNSLTSVVIPDSVTSIGDRAFQGCGCNDKVCQSIQKGTTMCNCDVNNAQCFAPVTTAIEDLEVTTTASKPKGGSCLGACQGVYDDSDFDKICRCKACCKNDDSGSEFCDSFNALFDSVECL